MQTAGHSVELYEPGGDPCYSALSFVELLNRLDCLHYLVLHGKHLTFEAVFADREDSLFHFIEQIIHLVLLFVGAPYALGRGGNDLAQDVLIANNLEVVPDIRSGRNEGEKAGDKCRAAYAVEKVPITQHLCECDQVDRLSRIPTIDKDVVNRPVRWDIKVFFINFLDAFRDRFTRRDEHRPENALLRFHAMRRCAVNILRRTCGRNGNNFFAAPCRRTSASAISRFARLLSCPCGRLSRHLFRFFSSFFFSSEKSVFLLLLRFLGRSAHRLSLWFLCGFYLENKLCCRVVMQLDQDHVLAGIFNRSFQHNLVAIDLSSDFILESMNDILRGDRAESFACFTGREREGHAQFPYAPAEFFRFVQFARLTVCAFLLQIIELTQSCGSNFVCFACRQQIIARVAASHSYDIRFRAQTRNIFSQNQFSCGHLDLS